MKLKDVIHLYLGQKAILKDDDGLDRKFVINAYNLNYYRDYLSDIYLLLRPLDSMTEEENNEFKTINRGNWIDMHWYSEGYLWLLSKGFDLFNLIPNGEALNINEYKP